MESTYTSTRCAYCNNGRSWSEDDMKNPVYVGNNSSGSNKYVGRWTMPAVDTSHTITRITMHYYQNSATGRTEYVGLTQNPTDTGSVLAAGVTMQTGQGWQSADVTGIKDILQTYEGTWYLLIGNPNTNGTYAEIAGHGSGKMLYIVVEFDDGSKVYYASSSSAVTACEIYYATDTQTATKCDMYYAIDANTVVKM